MRAIGFKPRRFASAALISVTAAAPSLRPEALPAVTVPSLEKAGLSFANTSAVVPARGYSSVSKTNVCVAGLGADFALGEAPFPLVHAVMFTSTGIVSSLNLPPAMAASAFL